MEFILDAYKEFSEIPRKLDGPVVQVPLHMESSTYIDDKILHNILQTFKTGNLHRFRYFGVSVELTIAGSTKKKEDFIVYYTCFLAYLFKKKAGRDIQHVSIKLVCYDGEKKLPGTNESLTPYHINGGITMSGGVSADVVVYRNEEIIKVLTHELVHAFGLDAKYTSPEQESFFNEYFGITCRSATINESFTDSLACYINTVVYSFLYNRKNPTGEFKKRFAQERRHILSQACKVLSHNGYYKEGGVLRNRHLVCEKTHVTSYYVLKAVVYTDVSAFERMLLENSLCIHLGTYIGILKNNLPLFVKNAKLSNPSKRNSSLRMSKLDLLELVYGPKTAISI